jgi:hypothetical protein
MMHQRVISISLMVSLMCLSTAPLASADVMRRAGDAALLKQKIELCGVGTSVKVKLVKGRKIKGTVASIGETGFAVEPEKGVSRLQANYDQISELSFTVKGYKASGKPDASEARRVVAALGAGSHVMARTTEEKIHGRITAVESDHFVILPDDQVKSVEISYQDVQQVGKNLGFFSTIGIIVVAIVVIIVVNKVS